ncbi:MULTISPECIES: NAD-binding protein [Actinoplanes]|uniref:NAD-binding protein n=1 Tax=Actinoplanes TaxID=1865 RepID=UPI0005F285E2|nr:MULTISPECIES: NAD-binding protein [Actinoplanes]
MLAVQHVHSSMLALLAGLRCGGADPASVTVVGKSYSTRLPAVEALRAAGARVVDPLRMADPLHSYEDELAAQVTSTIAELRPRLGAGTGLLVIDEGAVATKALLQTGDADLLSRVHVVEQTTRGARWTEAAAPPFPVVDVARSAAKADLEGPLVTASMVDGLSMALTALNHRPERIGIVGYGRMGARLAGLLSADHAVVVHDTAAQNLAAARADGRRVLERDALFDEVDVLIGCTGSPILDAGDLAAVTRPLVLVNGASSDIEFAVWRYRTAAAILPGSGGTADQPWLNHYAVGPTSRQVLVAGGFPTNFHLPGEPISPQDFQVTRALMLAGATQTMNRSEPGLVPLDAAAQAIVADAYGQVTSLSGR